MTPDTPNALNPRFRSARRLRLEDIPTLTRAEIDALFPNFVTVWRSFLHELAQQSAEESA